MKPTPKQILEAYQTATESLEDMIRLYELDAMKQRDRINELEEALRDESAKVMRLAERLRKLEECHPEESTHDGCGIPFDKTFPH